MEQLIADGMNFLRTGFNEVNAVQGLLIALIATVLMSSYKQIFAYAFGAALIHVVMDVMLPVLARGGTFRLPPLLEPAYWQYVATLFVGFLIIILLFFFLKRTFLR